MSQVRSSAVQEDLVWANGGTTFSSSTTLKIGSQLLERLEALHVHAYIHNDLKPSNVLLGAEGRGNEGVLHLVDFGIASPSPRASAESASRPPPFASLQEGASSTHSATSLTELGTKAFDRVH